MTKLLLLAALPAVLASLAAVASVAASGTIRWLTRDRVISGASELPFNEVGLVLGTSKFSGPLRLRNPHFAHRVEAAAELYKLGKVAHLLLSGDNGTRGYQEPEDMRADLQALGVPEDATTLDNAGYRTLDSIVRAKLVFGQARLTIITDRFHAFRALFLARHQGIDAVAFPCREVAVYTSMKSRLREYGADMLACLDLYVFHTAPRILGPPIVIRVAKR